MSSPSFVRADGYTVGMGLLELILVILLIVLLVGGLGARRW